MKESLVFGIRVTGLVLIAYTLSKAPVHTMAYSVRPEYGIVSYLVPFLIPIIAGLLMLMFPYTIGNMTMGKSKADIIIDNPRALLQIALISIGVIFLVLAISDGVFHLSTAVALYTSPDYDLNLQTFDYPGVIATCIEVIISTVLIFKSNAISAVISKQ